MLAGPADNVSQNLQQLALQNEWCGLSADLESSQMSLQTRELPQQCCEGGLVCSAVVTLILPHNISLSSPSWLSLAELVPSDILEQQFHLLSC